MCGGRPITLPSTAKAEPEQRNLRHDRPDCHRTAEQTQRNQPPMVTRHKRPNSKGSSILPAHPIQAGETLRGRLLTPYGFSVTADPVQVVAYIA